MDETAVEIPEAAPPYTWEHIATDPLHIKKEMRYAVIRQSDGETVARFVWSGEAEAEARRLSLAAGACRGCGGTGEVQTGWNYDIPLGGECPACGGTGREASND